MTSSALELFAYFEETRTEFVDWGLAEETLHAEAIQPRTDENGALVDLLCEIYIGNQRLPRKAKVEASHPLAVILCERSIPKLSV